MLIILIAAILLITFVTLQAFFLSGYLILRFLIVMKNKELM